MGTAISWCDETWNCVTGCSRVSEGQIGAMKGLFREGLQNAPISDMDMRRVFTCSVTTQRTIGGPGWPQGSLPWAGAAVGNPTGRWSVARHRRAEIPQPPPRERRHR